MKCHQHGNIVEGPIFCESSAEILKRPFIAENRARCDCAQEDDCFRRQGRNDARQMGAARVEFDTPWRRCIWHPTMHGAGEESPVSAKIHGASHLQEQVAFLGGEDLSLLIASAQRSVANKNNARCQAAEAPSRAGAVLGQNAGGASVDGGANIVETWPGR